MSCAALASSGADRLTIYIIETLMDVSQALNCILTWVLSLRHIFSYCIQLWLLIKASLCDNGSCFVLKINTVFIILYKLSMIKS
jgi:hypothetical protein